MNKLNNDPMRRMYDSFSLFGEAVKVNNEKFYPISSGVNWNKANSSLSRLLHWELDSAINYRNYGRSSGMKVVTDILSDIEMTMSGSLKLPSTVIVNGSSDGAYLVVENLIKTQKIQEGDVAMMLSHGFPFYSKVSADLGLDYVECLNEADDFDTFMAPIDLILEKLDENKPKLLFLLFPNNPLGERYHEDDLVKIRKKCIELGTKILIDRVCLLPWDDYQTINKVFIDQLVDGSCFIVDSMSKAESLAGVRTGYIVTDAKTEQELLARIQFRSLNPIVYSTLSMAISKALALVDKFPNKWEEYTSVLKSFFSTAVLSYPSNESIDLSGILDEKLRSNYHEEIQLKKQRILENFEIMKTHSGDRTLKALKLESGYNVALAIEGMNGANIKEDQHKLAFKHNVGMLTENCFRLEEKRTGNYFVRIGLTLPRKDFEESFIRLIDYYSRV